MGVNSFIRFVFLGFGTLFPQFLAFLAVQILQDFCLSASVQVRPSPFPVLGRHGCADFQHHVNHFIRWNDTAYSGKRHIRCRQRGHGAEAVAHDARNLDQSANRVADEP